MIENNSQKAFHKNKNKFHRQRRHQKKQNTPLKENKTNEVYISKEILYTRNSDPLTEGTRLSNIVLFDAKEEELDLHMIKGYKLCVSIPYFKDCFTKEIVQLDEIMKEFEDLHCYVISNDPVFTQQRLSKPLNLNKFQILSDFKNREFARTTATYIYEISALVKSVFLIDRNDKILFVRYYDDLIAPIDMNEIHEVVKKALEQ